MRPARLGKAGRALTQISDGQGAAGYSCAALQDRSDTRRSNGGACHPSCKRTTVMAQIARNGAGKAAGAAEQASDNVTEVT